MDIKLKQRVTGAIVLTALAIIILPMLLDGSEEDRQRVIASIPEAPIVDLDTLSVKDIEASMSALEAEGEASLPLATRTTGPAADPDDSVAGPGEGDGEPDEADTFQLDQNELPISWSLQLASFQNEDNARRLRASLRDAEYQSYILQAQTGQGAMYRVFVGPVLQRSQLDAIGQKIESEFELKGRIVRFDPAENERQLGG